MVKLKLYVNYLAKAKFKIIEIDNDKTFGELRKIVSESFNIDLAYLSLVVEGYSFNYEYDSKKLKDIDKISNGCLLYAIIFEPEIWTIYVHKYDEKAIIEIKINKNKTFYDLKKIVCEKLHEQDLFNFILLVGQMEYKSKYYSKKIKDIDGLSDGCTLFAVFIIGPADLPYNPDNQ